MSRAVTEESKSMSKSAHDFNSNKAVTVSIIRAVTVELSKSNKGPEETPLHLSRGWTMVSGS